MTGPLSPRRRDARLGPLERAVLDQLWEHGSLDVVSAHRAISLRRKLTPSTIHSTLERLVRKGFVGREKRGRAFWYRARLSRDEFCARALDDLIDHIPRANTGTLLASFVDFAERTSDTGLHELEALIRRRRREQEGE